MSNVIPRDWLQPADIARVILHWTAGQHKPSQDDRGHYHILISGEGEVVRGLCDIRANSSTDAKGRKAHHTLNCNTGSIGVSMACMLGAIERPLNVGKHPLTRAQWDKAAQVVAEICKHYKIAVTPRTVLSHAEVQNNLSIRQRGKWDIAILPWDLAFDTARECGDRFRTQVQDHLDNRSTPWTSTPLNSPPPSVLS